jgi:DNA processing protein
MGTNRLIQDGEAKLLASATDLLYDYGFQNNNAVSDTGNGETTQDSQSHPLLKLISTEPIHVDELCDRTQTSASEMLVSLLQLECRGLIRQLPGKYFCLIPMG